MTEESFLDELEDVFPMSRFDDRWRGMVDLEEGPDALSEGVRKKIPGEVVAYDEDVVKADCYFGFEDFVRIEWTSVEHVSTIADRSRTDAGQECNVVSG